MLPPVPPVTPLPAWIAASAIRSDRVAAVAATRVSGQSAEQYLYWSIVRPGQHLVAGYSNLMYAEYEDSLEAADIADLIAYLLTLD